MFYCYFFLLEKGKGESEAPGEGRGGRFFIASPRRGGRVSRRVVWSELGNLGGRGLNFFFSGPKRPPSKHKQICGIVP